MYEGLRQNFNLAYLNAWKKGETGYPMVDACMRCLISTGWLNFRMRAMLVSFACNNLWIDWKIVAENLGPLFVDYEPGIHYPQVQMQAGITGINTVRIYNPIKQGLDHDPNGLFIKRWVPELKSTHEAIIHTPWLDQNNKYIIPIVDEAISRKAAADKIYAVRRRKDHPEHSGRVLKKHGSRKRKSIQNNKIINNQLNLF
jgi:deoxyribodipyrimidine photo-lyase